MPNLRAGTDSDRPVPRVEVSVRAQSDALLSEEDVVQAVCACWMVHDGPDAAAVEVALLDEKEHCELHAEFLDDPSATDVMAFPYEDDDLFGEVLVNVEMATARAREHDWSAREECLLYVVHGCLHLLGFDDRNDEDRARMRDAEQLVMQSLRSK